LPLPPNLGASGGAGYLSRASMAFLFNKFQEVRLSPLRISRPSPDLDLLGSRSAVQNEHAK
jgi:hypothetical protein